MAKKPRASPTAAAPALAAAAPPFTLWAHDVDDTKHYAVRLHVDCSGNGRIEAVDQISTQSYPVMTPGSPPGARIAAAPV